MSSIHDIVNALLSNQNELPHFHFNEALFKPFENLLCLELCDADVQDQASDSFFVGVLTRFFFFIFPVCENRLYLNCESYTGDSKGVTYQILRASFLFRL